MGQRGVRAAMSRAAAVVAAVMVVGSLTASPASAFDLIGYTFVPSSFCGSIPTTVVETGPPAGKSYVVPQDGVITMWTFLASASPPQLEFKAFRYAGATSYTVLGASAPTTPVASTTSTYPVRIPVRAGDLIGETFLANGQCATVGGSVATFTGDAPAGSTAVYGLGSGTFDIGAWVEGDADRDGYGDETQDGCPTQPTTHGPCDTKPPVTELGPIPRRTSKSTVKVRFTADEAVAGFQCRLTGKKTVSSQRSYRPCTSPTKLKHLAPGKYTVWVLATDVAGNIGGPARQKFVVEKKG